MSLSRALLFFHLILFPVFCLAQKEYVGPSKTYSFTVPANYKAQQSNHERNEFIFTNRTDTTSLVVNVNTRPMTTENLKAFKKASNAEVESKYFASISNPKIIKRGEVENYRETSIYFHVAHQVTNEAENDYMMTYIFYHKGKEINFIFRTKAYRLPVILEKVEEIVNSVKLL